MNATRDLLEPLAAFRRITMGSWTIGDVEIVLRVLIEDVEQRARDLVALSQMGAIFQEEGRR